MIAPIQYTVADAERFVLENLTAIMQAYDECADIPAWARNTPQMREAWRAGCWLNATLQADGATEAQVKAIGFAHGQRSVFGNTWEWAVRYANEFRSSGDTKDKPGVALADQINAEVLGKV